MAMRTEQWRYKIPLLIRSLFRRRQVEHELDEELRYHFERLLEQNRASGMTADAARKAARRALGSIEIRKEECRDSWVVAPLDRLVRDVRPAWRTLRRDLGFTIGVFGLLALGVGANVAVLSIVDSVLLEPLPYREPDRLVIIEEGAPDAGNEIGAVNARHFLEWRRGCDCFEALALVEWVSAVTLEGGADPERVPSVRVTPNLFSLLGVSAQIGRTLVPEDAAPGGDGVAVVISDGLWRRRFGGDSAALGRVIRVDGVPSVIVGVLPRGFRPYSNGPRALADVYRPWDVAAHAAEPWRGWNNDYSYNAIGRLGQGVSPEATLDRLNAIQAAIAAEHFGEDASIGLKAELVPLHERVTGASRQGLLLLLTAVAAALLVACLNVANLMLVRAAARRREAGVRAALGATRVAIFRGVLVESALLAFAGAAAGVGLAAAGLEAFERTAAAAGLPRVEALHMDGTALSAALVLAIVSTVAFGLLPALGMTRVAPQNALRASGRTLADTSEHVRLRQALVSAEVGLSTALLVVAGLLLVSFVRLDAVDRGFDPRNVLTAGLSLPAARYPADDDRLRFYELMLDRLRAQPGVVAAGITTRLPLTGSAWGSTAIAAGTNPSPEEQPRIQYRFVSPDYLQAMGVPLLAGRALDERDYFMEVAAVSERTADIVWRGGDAVGRRFHMGDPEELYEVVGVVPDVHSGSLASEPDPLVYVPLGAVGVPALASLAVRTDGDPLAAVGLLLDVVRSIDSGLAISSVQTMQQIDSGTLGARRVQLVLVVAFGAAALLIAALGTYSVLAYGIKIRLHALAMRMALGARPGDVLAMVLREGMKPVLIGLGLGIVAALLSGRLLSSLLYSVTPHDVPTLLAVAAVTLAASLLASLLPARHASRTSLLDALRHE